MPEYLNKTLFNMKIWIDFCNTPQVSFWLPFIKEFQEEKYELLLTCRDSSNTVALLQLYGLDYTIIGKKTGKRKIRKTILFIRRLLNLYLFVRKNKPDIAVSQSSFYQPIVSWLLGVNCLYTNDNEYARGNILAFIFATKVILPIALSKKAFVDQWPLKSKVSFYPSVKEAIYLSQQPELLKQNDSARDVVYFRTEPWSAQYYKGPLNFFDQTLLSLAEQYKLVILPRDKNQLAHYQQKKFNKLEVATKPITLNEIISKCLLFIGAGGSMTRELAVMGVPSMSIYQDNPLMVDKYLADKGCMTIKPSVSVDEINKTLQSDNHINNLSILDDGKKSYLLIKHLITNL